jgi:hypothetical protein
MKIVQFKSLPMFFFKEKDGAKPNTIRLVDYSDERFKALLGISPPKYIRITNSESPKWTFKRKITDISTWEVGGLKVAIISWKHEGKITWPQ